MRIIEQLVYKITGDNKEFDKSLDTSEKNTKKFGDVANKIFAGVTVTAVALAVKKLGELAISSATALDRIDKMSQKIGISRTSFQEWDFILSQSGASVDGLQMSLKTLATATEQADRGSKEYVDTFEQLGVSIYDTNGELKNQEELFNEVFVALANTENQTKRTALASALLGRSATELAPAMNAGGEAIEGMRKQAHDLGLVLGDELVDQGVVLTDNIDQMKRAFGAWRTEALAPVIGVLVTITDKLLNQKTATSEMAGVLDTIKTKTAEYKTISDQLVNTQNNLSDAERDLLLARKETLAFEIQKQLVSLASSYNETKDNITTLEGEVNNLNKLFDGQNAYLKTLTVGTLEYDNAQTALERIYGELVGKQQELSNAQISYNGLISEASKLVADGVLDIEKLADVNSELYNKIMDGAEAYTKQKEAIAEAKKEFQTWGDISRKELEDNIELLEANIEQYGENAYATELLTLAKAKLAEMTGNSADAMGEENNAIDEFNKRTKARADAIDEMAKTRMSDHEKALAEINEQAEAWLQAGVDRTEVANWVSEQIQKLIDEENAKKQALLDEENKRQEEETAKLEKEEDNRKKIREDAYKLMESYRQTDHEKAITAIQEQAQAFLQAGVDRVDVAKWQSEQIQALIEDEKFAWVDYSMSIASSIASMWNNINRIRENNHEEELNRMKEEGASQEEIDERKKELAREDLKRKKAQGTFQAIIDTASAVIGFLANPGGWAGIGLSAMAGVVGATQIGAINSEPLPAFEVGSIRIPETQQAVVHRNEMILPATIAEQARQEGISIAPSGGGTSAPIHLVVNLNGKTIIEETVKGINSGQYGKIDARITK